MSTLRPVPDHYPIPPQVRITEALKLPTPGRVPFSVEFMPPRDDAAEERLTRAAEIFHDLGVSFCSVTYGAGGTSRERTIRVGRTLASAPLTTLVHLTLIGHTKEDLHSILEEYRSNGLTNVLALRGDPPGDPNAEWIPTPGGFTYAKELIEDIRANDPEGEFHIGIASFPEKHYRSPSLEADTFHTLEKLRAGAEFSITQMFFDIEYYLRLRDRLIAADPIQGAKPIIPGIMPITSLRSVRRQMHLAGTKLPPKLEADLMKAAGDDEEKNRDAIRAVGIEYSSIMAEKLIAEGVPDLHFMTLNFARATQEVLHNLGMAPAWGPDKGHDAVR